MTLPGACLLPAMSKLHPSLLQLLALAPVLVWFAKRLDDGSDEPLGLLTLSLALVLAWRDRASLHAGPAARILGAVLVLASVLSIYVLPPMLRGALALTGISVCYGLHRRGGLIGLVLLSLPVMASLQFYIGYPMRVMAAEGSLRLLELGSLAVSRSGTQLELAGQVIGVDPACGGVRMLWHALAAAMALAALHRLSWRATIIAGLLAVLLVIPANTLRAALLVLKETGRISELFLGHSAIGLVSFGIILLPLWLAISTRARHSFPLRSVAKPGRMEWGSLTAAAVLAPLLAWGAPRTPERAEVGPLPVNFTFDGLTLPLAPLPASEAERAFAKSFPGTLSSHLWGGDQVILRRVNVATRRLHPSRDCLRAAGYETGEAITVIRPDGSTWSRFYATRDGLRLVVHERIVGEGDGRTWTDVSAWYWSALRRPLNGPWQAQTVIRGG
jgi:exosortase/archaeosortase family protein